MLNKVNGKATSNSLHALSKISCIGFTISQTDQPVLDFWNVEPIADYAKGCARGATIARELILYLIETRAYFVAGYIVKAMIEKGRFGAVEAGFMQAMAVAASRK